MDIDWRQMFVPQHSLLELFIRGSLIYLGIYFLFRFGAKRLGGGVALGNILVVVLIADAVQNGMAGDYKSVTEGLMLGVTIVFWNFVIEFVEYHVPSFRKILRSPPLMVIKDGQLIRKNMHKMFLNEAEIRSRLRLEGIDDVAKVKAAYIEDEGEISIIQKSQS